MSDNSSIEWTDATWNVVTGCVEVSPGCDHCYAKTFAERWRGVPGHHFEQGFDVVLRPERLDLPLRWKKPRRVFVNSMSDLFHEAVPDEFIVEVFARMWWSPAHTFQVLTKRHGRMRSLVPRIEAHLRERERDLTLVDCPTPLVWPLPNVWLGVSVENQQWADIRIPALLDTPAAVRWISAEPLLGPVDLSRWLVSRPAWGPEYPEPTSPMGLLVQDLVDVPALSWVVAGGESGPGARPMHPDWARGLRDQCTSASVPFFMKQFGQYAPVEDRPDGRDVWVALDGSTRPYLYDDGFTRTSGGDFRSGDEVLVRRWGSKHAAGRLLDGREWNEYPTVEPAVSR